MPAIQALRSVSHTASSFIVRMRPRPSALLRGTQSSVGARLAREGHNAFCLLRRVAFFAGKPRSNGAQHVPVGAVLARDTGAAVCQPYRVIVHRPNAAQTKLTPTGSCLLRDGDTPTGSNWCRLPLSRPAPSLRRAVSFSGHPLVQATRFRSWLERVTNRRADIALLAHVAKAQAGTGGDVGFVGQVVGIHPHIHAFNADLAQVIAHRGIEQSV